MSRIACITALILAATAASAQAATITVGLRELPTEYYGFIGCQAGESCPGHYLSSGLPDEAGHDRVPYDGRIIGWRFMGSSGNGTIRLRVAHGEGETLTSRGVSEPAPSDAFDGRLIPIGSPIPAEAGDVIGVSTDSSEGPSPRVNILDLAGAAYRGGNGTWPETGTFTPSYQSEHALTLNAELEIAPPLITALTPEGGAGGTTVTIAGDHFTGAERVTFGGTDGLFTVQSDTVITAGAPAGLAGPVPVVVQGPGGASTAATFIYPSSDPVVESLLIAPAAFRARKGATIVYRLSKAAQMTFAVQRARKGRRKGGRCVVGRKRGKRCIRWRRVPGSLAHAGAAGLNELAFTATLDGKRLKRGRYRLVAVATDAAGKTSAPVRKRFRVKR